MRQFVIHSLAAAAIGAALAFASAPAFAKTAAQCNADYAANKAAIKASGQTKKAYVAACRADTTGAPPANAAAPTAPAGYQPPPAPAPPPFAPSPNARRVRHSPVRLLTARGRANARRYVPPQVPA